MNNYHQTKQNLYEKNVNGAYFQAPPPPTPDRLIIIMITSHVSYWKTSQTFFVTI